MLGGLQLRIALLLVLTTHLSHEQQRLFLIAFIGLVENALHHADLIDNLLVVVLSSDATDIALDGTDESKQQISKHNGVEDESH